MMSLVRAESNGIQRYFSPYLASAFLMLYGGYQLLYQGGSNPYRDVLYIFGTQLAYQFLLVLLASYLYRKYRLFEDSFLLLGILGFFTLDSLFIQHLYGWSDESGMLWSISNCVGSLVLILFTSVAFDLRPYNRLTITLSCLVCFMRLGPIVLLEPQAFYEVSFSYVLLGWLFAVCLLPLIIFPEPKNKDLSFPMKKVEKRVLLFAFVLTMAHFVTAGESFNLKCLLLYGAPFCALLPLALNRFYDFDPSSLKRIAILTSVLSLFLAASNQAPPIFDVFGIGEGPFTPFWFTLLATTFVSWRLSSLIDSPALVHFSALTLAMSFLGGNLSEVFVTIFYPQTWHILFVSLICIAASCYTRLTNSTILLNVLPTLVIASWLATHQIPLFSGFIMTTAVSTLFLETTCRIRLAKHLRLLLIVLLLSISLGYLFVEGLTIHKIIFLLLCISFIARGLIFRNPYYLWPTVAAAALAAVGYPLAMQGHDGGSSGTILIQAAFILLIVGFANSVYGSKIRGFVKHTFGSVPSTEPQS